MTAAHSEILSEPGGGILQVGSPLKEVWAGGDRVRNNYILVDYENVQPDSFAVPDGEHCYVSFFLGPHQNRVPLQLAKAMQTLGTRGQWIQIPAAGRDALDFHIAFHIGEIVTRDAGAHIHVISKDTGFDPLLRFLKKERGVTASRYESFEAIPLARAGGPSLMKERVATVVSHFQHPKTPKPRTRTTLSNQVSNLFQKTLTAVELEELIAEIIGRGYVAVDGSKVEHRWPVANPESAEPAA